MLSVQTGNRNKIVRSALLVSLLNICMLTACGHETGKKATEEMPLADTFVLEQNIKEDDEADNIEPEQEAFTEEDLPEAIKNLLSYEKWTGSTQATSCTRENIQESDLAEVFQQILCGDFSSVLVLETEEEREEMQKEYEGRENWEFLLTDMDGDDAEELCIKDNKGKLGIFDEFYGGLYLPGRIEYWTFGEPGDDLLAI